MDKSTQHTHTTHHTHTKQTTYWCEGINLSDSEIKNAFIFARACTKNIFDQVFQFKIVTQILPTNKYLKRYKVKDSDICSKCLIEQDTVLHSLWSCPSIVPFVSKIIEFLKIDCNVKEDISTVPYIFGFKNNTGLNHILIELKKYIFYNWKEGVGIVAFCERFKAKIRKIIVMEKHLMISDKKFEIFFSKWKEFREFYDFLGPDCQIIS